MTHDGEMSRRPELDWLRVVAIAILHIFHVGMVFNTWDFYFKNPDPLLVLEMPMRFLHQVRMPLLMVISGTATAIALERRSVAHFTGDRIKRLLLPLVFGMFVVVPPQIYIERVTCGGFTGSYMDFYRSVFELRSYPAGNLGWHHLWFVAYLFLYCMAALPLFVGLTSVRGKRLLGWLDRAWSRGWVAALFVPLAIEKIVMAGAPEVHNLTHDPDTFMFYAMLFLIGHMLGRSRTVWDHLVVRRWRYLAALCVMLAVMLPPNEYPYPFEQLGTTIMIWLVVLNALAWSRWYFRRPAVRVPSWLDHAQKLSYPFYIVHQTVILIFGWLWLGVAMGPWPRFGVVLVSSFIVTWALCELISRSASLRPLFGMGPRRVVPPALARLA